MLPFKNNSAVRLKGSAGLWFKYSSYVEEIEICSDFSVFFTEWMEEVLNTFDTHQYVDRLFCRLN